MAPVVSDVRDLNAEEFTVLSRRTSHRLQAADPGEP